MSIKDWWLANQQDERERFYIARAYQWAFTFAVFTSLAIAASELAHGHLGGALVAMLPGDVGFVVAAGLMIHWKVTR
jgi:hypothetical protein